MESLKVIGGLVLGMIGLGIAALIASAFFPAYGSGFDSTALIVGLLLALGLWVVVAVLRRRANAPAPPRYSDLELQDRVRAALQSKSQAYVKEVINDVAAQWGDNRDYRKLSTKLSTLRGLTASPEVPDSRGPADLKGLYPNIYSDWGKEGNLKEDE